MQIRYRMELLFQICDRLTEQLDSNGHHHLVLATRPQRFHMDRGIWRSHYCTQCMRTPLFLKDATASEKLTEFTVDSRQLLR